MWGPPKGDLRRRGVDTLVLAKKTSFFHAPKSIQKLFLLANMFFNIKWQINANVIFFLLKKNLPFKLSLAKLCQFRFY